jgi:glycosyltransferase involved in cell wall biosynthesis
VIRIAHVIAGLDTDGAETVLHSVTSRMDREPFENEVISLTSMGPMAERLNASGMRVRALGMRRGSPNPYHLLRLSRWLRESQTNLVQTWMYHADLVGGLAARLAGKPVIWGIHHTNLDRAQNKRLTIWTAKVCARLSHATPQRIVCCSEASRRAHVEFGYAEQKMLVIPNGFDLQKFRPDTAARSALRRQLGITEETPLIGMGGRFHVQKGHKNFIEAAARLHAQAPEVRFVLCGKDVDENNATLASWIAQGGADLHSVCRLLGTRQDMARFFSALDIATSPSLSEAFPMAVGEAMACGTPCVVTDVGDSALIVGDTGRVVPANDPQALAEAWQALLRIGPAARGQLGQAARNRIERRFDIGATVERYQELYREVLSSARSAAAQRSDLASTVG